MLHEDSAPASAKEGVESNSRLTATVGLVLLVLLAVEGYTILGVRQHLTLHVFLGMAVIPPVLLKMASTTWRFAQYYRGEPAYKEKGPPPIILRLLGPLLVVLTAVMLVSGVALLLRPNGFGGQLMLIHKASFILWFAVMTVHVLGHVLETFKLASLDLAARTRSQVKGAGLRQWALVISLCAGGLLGVVMLHPTTHYLHQHQFGFFKH